MPAASAPYAEASSTASPAPQAMSRSLGPRAHAEAAVHGGVLPHVLRLVEGGHVHRLAAPALVDEPPLRRPRGPRTGRPIELGHGAQPPHRRWASR